ncbi:MAG TPA: ATP-binding protein [Candidatus Aminicenantes bacterium]|nr:ATP-binding protein [Candidatus Aminicenantes bacterium]HRY65572.1 ATP-binding protein [Candidatus Aminicenantes bacterium]HRZ72540.1 ATP-binding protein [Candidatus Aminicenantes bacterium]
MPKTKAYGQVVQSQKYEIADPRPSALIESLRSVGYKLSTAIADIVDNSIAADARNIWIRFKWAGAKSLISIIDDGRGMTESALVEAMRPGSISPIVERSQTDLGRFGLGLKTASFSQCRRLTVISRSKGCRAVTRVWDLDYVVRHDEWRLLRSGDELEEGVASFAKTETGTAVIWTHLDRIITQGENANDASAHNRFNDSIDQVRQHLAVIYHRFIEAGEVRIFINNNLVNGWNPYLENHKATYRAPDEIIPFGKSKIYFRGYVLPHKDMLTHEQYESAAGPLGWTAHQGFYVYRNRRLLVPGDWLGLGSPKPWIKAEHYNLARICLDISNDADNEWHLDVKKSMARPPALVKERLTELAENIRKRARSVFAHRGKYGARISPISEYERPWEAKTRQGYRIYKINRGHPAVSQAIQAAGTAAPDIESMLRILEETVPVQQIWLDIADQTQDVARPFIGTDYSVIRSDLRKIYIFLTKSGIDRNTALARLKAMEPYNHYTNLINEL